MSEEPTTAERRTYLKASGVAALAGITGLAGCSQGDSSGSTSGGTTGGTSESETFTIAATAPLSGGYSSIGPDLKHGYELGVERINANGGLQGRTVELVLKDDESTARKVRQQLTRITSNNDVDMIWGTFAGLLNQPAIAFAESKEIPLLAVAVSGDQVHEERGYEWASTPFPVSSDHARTTMHTLDLIPEDERPSDVAIWAPNADWSIEMADMWEQTLTENGYNIVQRQKHGVGAKDFSTLISQAQSAGAEVLLDTPVPPGGITAMKQINESNWSPKFIQLTRAADTSSWWSALGEAGEYVCMAPGWVPGLTGNGNAQMAQAYRDTYDIASDDLLPVIVGAAYNITQVTEQAVNAASGTDRASVRDAIRNNEYQTVIGEFGFDDVGRPTGLDAPMGQWVDGDQHLVYPQTDSEAFHELTYPIPE